jgi:hypothetical protein
MTAQNIRNFFETLFTGRLVLQLRADLEEARCQRDYFKGRAERLELQLLQPRSAARQQEASDPPRIHNTRVVGGRKTWGQLVAERRKELAEKAMVAERGRVAESKKDSTNTPAPVPAQN